MELYEFAAIVHHNYGKSFEPSDLEFYMTKDPITTEFNCAVQIAYEMIFRHHRTYVTSARLKKIAKKTLDQVEDIIKMFPEILTSGIYKRSAYELRLNNGCVCLAKTISVDSFRGYCISGLHLHDEGSVKNISEVYELITPVFSASKTSFIIKSR